MFDIMKSMAAGEPTTSGSDASASSRDLITMVDSLRTSVDELADMQVDGFPIQQVGALIQRIEAARAVLDVAASAIIGRFDAEGGAAHEGLRSTNSLLQQHAQMSSATATKRVRVARALRHLPDLAERCRSGRLTADQADVFARSRNERTEEAMSHDESALADLAERLRPDDFAREMRAWAEMVDTDGAEPEPGHRGRSFSFVQTLDDSWTGRLDLGSADGLFVDSAIEAMAESLWRTEDRSTDGERRSRSQRRADALVELIRRGCAKQRAGASAVVSVVAGAASAGASATGATSAAGASATGSAVAAATAVSAAAAAVSVVVPVAWAAGATPSTGSAARSPVQMIKSGLEVTQPPGAMRSVTCIHCWLAS